MKPRNCSRIRIATAAFLAAALPGLVGPVSAPAAESTGDDRSIAPHDVIVWEGEHRIPAIVLSNKGTLLAFSEQRYQPGDHGNVDLVLKRSSDSGNTWSEPILVHEEGGDAPITIGNPSPVVDRETGTIWLAFTRNNERAFVTHSEDDGMTWAEPREITGDVKLDHWTWYAFGPCHAIQLRSGRLLIPANHRSPQNASDSNPSGNHSHIIFSDDHGKTWKLGGSVPLPSNESCAVELADGTVSMNSRSLGQGRRVVALSADGGETWKSAVMDEMLVEPVQFGTGCQGSVIRLTDEKRHDRNRLLFSNPASAKRERLTVRVSYDEGRTWTACKALKPQGHSGYSDLVVLPDMSIGLIYETNDVQWRRIRFARFTLDWLTDGKDKVVRKRRHH
ncbi:MAG: sialidase family protein [Planctomycetales bacterium]